MVLTVFWPTDALLQDGLFFGWYLSFQNETYAVVAGITPDTTSEERERLTSQIAGYAYSMLKDMCALEPRILGRCLPATAAPGISRPRVDFDADVGKTQNESHNVVFYLRPQLPMMRFLSFGPLQLDISAAIGPKQASPGVPGALSANSSLFFSLDFSNHDLKSRNGVLILKLLNCALELYNLVSLPTKPLPQASSSSRSWLKQTFPGMSQPMTALVGRITNTLLAICNLSVPVLENIQLKDLSATIQQMDIRLEQIAFLPLQFRVIRNRRRNRVEYFAAHYISFYNCIWLVWNDIIVGTAFGAFLCENCDILGEMLRGHSKYLAVDLIHSSLTWLDNWPVGLKLNTQLSRFFCLLFMGLTDLWGHCLSITAPYFPSIIYFIGTSGRLGLTMVLSLLSDLLGILTFHLYICYLIGTAIFSVQLTTAGSLYNLFRGKRRNVLRNRTDSWEYDLDQLLLGTILFTLLAFLFPTVLVYYLTFAVSRLCIISLHASLETSLSFMNHFPLFAMMLRLKDPSRLPGGIAFIKQSSPDGPKLCIKNQPIPFSHIFFQHLVIWSKLSAHYHPLRLLRCLLTGTFITPIPRYSIRYTMIPKRRDSFSAPANVDVSML